MWILRCARSLHLVTWLALALTAVLLVLIIVPSSREVNGAHILRLGNDKFTHGWPWPYLQRWAQVAETSYSQVDKPGCYHLPAWRDSLGWAFTGDAVKWNRAVVVADLAVALAILLVVGSVVELWRRKRTRLWQVSLREVLFGTLLISLPLWWWQSHRRLHEIESQMTTDSALQGVSLGYFLGSDQRPLWLSKLVGPAALTFCEHVDEVSLDADSVDPERAFPYLRRLLYLKQLSINGSRISPQVVDILADLPNVTHVDISCGNSSVDTVDFDLRGVQRLPQCQQLTQVQIHAPQLQATDLRAVLGLKNLTELTLDDAKIDLAAWAELTQARSLTKLTISSIPMGRAELQQLQKLPALSELRVDEFAASADGLSPLVDFPRLRSLSLPYIQLNDDVLAQVSKFTKLETLSVGGFSLASTNFRLLADMAHLRTINIFSDDDTDNEAKAIQAVLPKVRVIRLDPDYSMNGRMENDL